MVQAPRQRIEQKPEQRLEQRLNQRLTLRQEIDATLSDEAFLKSMVTHYEGALGTLPEIKGEIDMAVFNERYPIKSVLDAYRNMLERLYEHHPWLKKEE